MNGEPPVWLPLLLVSVFVFTYGWLTCSLYCTIKNIWRGDFSTLWALYKQTFVLIKEHKKLLIFPLLLLLCYCTMLCLPFALGALFKSDFGEILGWVSFFMLFWRGSRFPAFIHVALCFYTAHLLDGHPSTIFESLKRSWQRYSTIKEWTCFNLFPEDNSDSNNTSTEERNKGWCLSLLLPPLLALNNLSCKKNITLSWNILKRTWGKSILIYTGFGGILRYTLLRLTYALVFPWGVLLQNGFFSNMTFTPSLLFFSAVIFSLFLIAGAINNAITTIIHTALLYYAEEKNTGPFDKKLLHNLL